jgi:hypothetical protein
MFEIWRHRASGERFLVVVRAGQVAVAAGPLPPGKDPRRVLESHGCQAHNPRALPDMRRTPGADARDYTTDKRGRAVPVAPAD